MVSCIGTSLQLHPIITTPTLNFFWTASVWRYSMKNLSLNSKTSVWRISLSFLFKVKLKLKLCYDRRSVGQSVLESSTHLGLKTRFSFLLVAGLLIWGAISDERTGLTFTMYNAKCTIYLHFTCYDMNVYTIGYKASASRGSVRQIMLYL
jgi:hypothetical protein